MAQKSRADIRAGVHSRIRKKVSGTAERPRLAASGATRDAFSAGTTLATASTVEKALGVKAGGNVESAKVIGKAIAERAIAAGGSTVVYDRGGYLFHGRVKALIDATREAGLNKHEVAAQESND